MKGNMKKYQSICRRGFKSLYSGGELGIFPSPKASLERESSEFF